MVMQKVILPHFIGILSVYSSMKKGAVSPQISFCELIAPFNLPEKMN